MATTEFMRLTMPSLLLLVAAALLSGCLSTARENPEEGSEQARVRLGQEFKLRVGQRVTVEGLRVRFAAVANDSRCPADVTCVWAGNAEVQIEAEAGGSRKGLKLNTQGGDGFPNESRHKQYIVGLVSLSPHPRTDRKMKAANYVATLVIRKE